MEARKRTSYESLKNLIDERKGQKSINHALLINNLKAEFNTNEIYQKPKYKNALKLFEIFIEGMVFVDERLIDNFRLWLNEGNSSGTEGKSASANIVHIINEFAGRKWLRWPVLVGSPVRKLFRFMSIDDLSREMFVHFEKYARQIRTNRLPVKDETGRITIYKEFVLLKKELAPIPRYSRLDDCLSLLVNLKKQNINQVSKEELLDDKLVSLASLKNLSPAFANFHKWGFLRENPFCEIDYMKPKYDQNIEFITKDSMDSLLAEANQLSGKSASMIRSLCLCLLAYDSCMRIGELLSLKLSDFTKEDGVDVLRIRSEIQKGQGKNEKYIVFHFPETSRIIDWYTNKVRKRINTDTEIFFIGDKGRAISYTSARKDVKRVQDELNLKLYHDSNAVITPHHFRRTFGTLNAPGIGLNLPIDELADRMRHNDPATTRGHYISRNIYLERMKLRESIIKKKRTSSEAYSDEEVDKFLNWLKVDKSFPKELVSEIRERIYSDTVKKALKKYDPSSAEIYDVTEIDALKRLAHFNIKIKGLRDYCLENNRAIENESDIYLYSSQFLDWLCENYVPLKVALETLCITKPTIYNNSEIFMPICIGRSSLILKSSIGDYIQHGGTRNRLR